MRDKPAKNAPLGFELWDKETRNALGGYEYETETAALSAAALIIAKRRPEHLASLVLLRVGPRGGLKRVAGGADLVVRARATAAASAQRVATASQPQGSPSALVAQTEG